jgi:quinolinate synthase
MKEKEAKVIIRQKKAELGDKLIILGHHYQSDEIIEFCDYTGDSLELARKASIIDKAETIVFCGVYFMAETASILAPGKRVYIPDPSAGCPLADMAKIKDVEHAWQFISRITRSITPVTYVNSSAELKAFCGRNNGAVCTSGNALKVFEWAFKTTDKIMFFPDKNLGRNTARLMGISDDLIKEWDPEKGSGGLNEKAVQAARVILWKGWCPIHWPEFSVSDVERVRKNYPGIKVIVHPESDPKTVKASDASGSTAQILNYVNSLPKGDNVAIGTEWNMVHRVSKKMQPDLNAIPLKEVRCADMAKITMEKLALTLSDLGKAHEVKVPDHVARDAKVALEIMLKV